MYSHQSWADSNGSNDSSHSININSLVNTIFRMLSNNHLMLYPADLCDSLERYMNISYLLCLGGYSCGRCHRWRRRLGRFSKLNSQGAEEGDTGLRWMQVRCIGVDSENTDFHATGDRTSVAEVRWPRLSHQQSPSDTVPFGRCIVNARPPEVNFVAAVAFVVLQVIPRPINDLSHHLSVNHLLPIPVAVLINTSAIHHPQRRRFPNTDRSSNYQVKWYGQEL